MNAALFLLAPYKTELTGLGVVLPAAVARDSGEVVTSTPLPGMIGSHLSRLLAEVANRCLRR